MMIFNSVTVANDYNLARSDRTAVAFSCRQIKLLKALILLSSFGEISSKGVVNSLCI